MSNQGRIQQAARFVFEERQTRKPFGPIPDTFAPRTINVDGMLFVNRCTWAHILAETAPILGLSRENLLTPKELSVLEGRAAPEGVII